MAVTVIASAPVGVAVIAVTFARIWAIDTNTTGRLAVRSKTGMG
jgi:hypothetical protein